MPVQEARRRMKEELKEMKKCLIAMIVLVEVFLLIVGIGAATEANPEAPPIEMSERMPSGGETPTPSVPAPPDGSIAIDETNFPDAKFSNCVSKFDKDGDGFLSSEEIKKVTVIDVRGRKNDYCYNLKGIEYFTNLKTLYCYGDNGKRGLACNLDLSKNTKLESIGCHNTNIKSLKLGKNTKLTKIVCYNTKLTKLDVSKCTNLRLLNCSNCKIKTLNVSGCKYLKVLQCDLNALTELDVQNCKNLSRLTCDHNSLKTLNLKGLKSLTELDCSYNKLKTLTLTGCKALKQVETHRNSLKKLDITASTSLCKLVKTGKRESVYSTSYQYKNTECLLTYDKATKLVKK